MTRTARSLFLSFATFALLVTVALGNASASKEVVDAFGEVGVDGGQFAPSEGSLDGSGRSDVNTSGTGPADPGDVYVIDGGGNTVADNNHRIQRFARNDNGTPAEPYDDTYEFVSAWGADVVEAGGAGDKGDAEDANYEICTVAGECKAGVASGGNGSLAGNGSLDRPIGVAVDEDTGRVYVGDANNNRINVYAGDGTFLRSFGWDVTASGPGEKAAPNEVQQVKVKADGGKFSLLFRGSTTGAFGKSGVSPKIGFSAIGEVTTISGKFEVGQGFGVAQFSLDSPNLFPAGTTIAAVEPGKVTASKAAIASNTCCTVMVGDDLDYDSTAAELEAELNALPTIGGVGGSVSVSGGPGDSGGSTPYSIEFEGALAGEDLPELQASDFGLVLAGVRGDATVSTTVTGGTHEVCVAADGDVCKAGSPGSGAGQLGSPYGPSLPSVAVSQADGNPTNGTLFATDGNNFRVNSYDLDGSAPSSFGSAAEFPGGELRAVAVDSRGIVYASNIDLDRGQPILRYDSENANGGGVGFLKPIPAKTIVVRIPKDATTAREFIFEGELGETDVPQITVSNGTEPLSEGGASVTTITPGGPGVDEVQRLTVTAKKGQLRLTFDGQTTGDLPFSGAGASVALEELSTVPDPALPPSYHNGTIGLAVDPDSDGAGPDEDVLYALRTENPASGVRSLVYQFGPVNDPGLADPPTAYDDVHGEAIGFTFVNGFGIDRASGRLFVATGSDTTLGYKGTRVYVLDEASAVAPSGTIDSVSDITPSTATVHATVDPNGPPLTSIQLEYSLNGSDWTLDPGSETPVGTQDTPQAVSAVLDPGATGLLPGTEYHVRVVIAKAFSAPMITSALTFTTPAGSPVVETVGSPVRGATTARLEGRVDPRGAATTYHFEYGASGPCSSNPCQASDPLAAGSGAATRLVSQGVDGLSPDTTYHYRLVADNGVGGTPVFGGDMTLTTRASDQLTPSEFPGPVGSDRGWEQVSISDSGGNPIVNGSSFSDDGERAVYQNAGGSPSVDSGSLFSMLFAERTPSGWRTTQLAPSRDQVVAPNWFSPTSTDDLTSFFTPNFNPTTLEAALWQLRPGASPVRLHFAPAGQYGSFFAASDDGSRKVAALEGNIDPEHPVSTGKHLYDVSSGTPQLVSLLPGDTVAACGVDGLTANAPRRPARWVSPEGALLLFPSAGNVDCTSAPLGLYLRDLVAGETVAVSSPPLSGPLCDAEAIKQTPGAVFFRSASRLVAEDAKSENCLEGRDVYRYDVGTEELECITCLPIGLTSEVSDAAVAPDGSRVYFKSARQLLPGALTPAVYRIAVESGALAYVGPIDKSNDATLGRVGEGVETANAISPDGAVLIFRSAVAALNPANGSQNGGTAQYYRYDDEDRSLVCVSCPPDGTAPAKDASNTLYPTSPTPEVGPNSDPLDDAGKTFVFATPNALVNADQNTALEGDPARGQDVYEWRDGRVLLVSDGLTNWPNVGVAPTPNGVSADGSHAFFTASTQYTKDAIDEYNRLYDAHIGGGFAFPPPPKPCPLEVCQGTPKGAPDRVTQGTRAFVGPGNPASARPKPRCPKGKRKLRQGKKTRCVKSKTSKAKAKKANDERRAQR